MSIQSNLFKLPSNVVVDPNSSDQVSSGNNGGTGSDSNGVPSGGAAAFPNTPRGMADRFGVPYLGKLPMDPNMMKACEEGKSFLEAYPGSAASGPFADVVAQIVAMTPDV
jgi:hypothetical protein